MKWRRRDLGDGMTSEGEHIDANTYEWSTTIKDKNGKVYLDVRAKHTRSK